MIFVPLIISLYVNTEYFYGLCVLMVFDPDQILKDSLISGLSDNTAAVVFPLFSESQLFVMYSITRSIVLSYVWLTFILSLQSGKSHQ